MSDKEALAANRRLWDERARLHFASPFYDVEGFRHGRDRLHRVELEELGAVAGLELLHLQCHFGLDTLSLARLGARVTGVDFSDVAIAKARELAQELGLEARFVRADVLALPAGLSGRFDIVYTSRGVLCWIPDLHRWAAGIARCLKPGGIFYAFEDHPVAAALDLDESSPLRAVAYPFFSSAHAQRIEVEGSYADRSMSVAVPTAFEWSHALGEVVTSLLRAGLRIESLREFPFSFWRRWSVLEERSPDEWWLPSTVQGELPLTFSLLARKA